MAKALILKQLSWIYPILMIKTGFRPEIIIDYLENSFIDFYLKVGSTLIGLDLRRLLVTASFGHKSATFE